MSDSKARKRDADPVSTAIPAATGRRNTAVLVGFTAATSLADGVMKMALPFLAAQLTDSPPRSPRSICPGS